MTKKKKGFFSWFGFSRQDEKQKQDTSADVNGTAEAASEVKSMDDQRSALASEAAGSINRPEERDSVSSTEQVDDNSPAAGIPHHAIESVSVEPSLTHWQPAARMDEVVKGSTDLGMIEEQCRVETAGQEQAKPVFISATITETIEAPQAASVADVDQVQHERVELTDPGAEISEDSGIKRDTVVDPGSTIQQQEGPGKAGFFIRLKRSLLKTKQNLGSGFFSLFRGKKIDDNLFEELEEQLLIADVGVDTTSKIIGTLTQHASRKQLKDAESLYGKLKEEMGEILAAVEQPLDTSGKRPFVILMVGVNGVGKTTTIGKLSRQFQAEGKSVMLAAGDTFRAAAVEQLQAWGQRNHIPVIAQHTGADSASVIYDAMQAAQARNIDVLLADTAGRLQNKAHLMEELKKIVRVMKKLDGQAPDEIMLTIDASTGQNAVNQVKLFHEAVGLTGITLTKLDGTAKGGVIFAVADQYAVPIRYIGVGEGIEDLRPFKAHDFIEALFARED